MNRNDICREELHGTMTVHHYRPQFDGSLGSSDDRGGKPEIHRVRARDIGLPKGIVSTLEIVSRVVAGALDTGKVKVREVMTPLVSIEPDEDLMNAAEIMFTKKLSCLTVVKEGIVYGVLTAQGIAERVSTVRRQSCKGRT